jgi:hypothetical protein
MMDIGIGRFLEMFEERFGRFATSIFLLVVALALVAYSIGII